MTEGEESRDGEESKQEESVAEVMKIENEMVKKGDNNTEEVGSQGISEHEQAVDEDEEEIDNGSGEEGEQDSKVGANDGSENDGGECNLQSSIFEEKMKKMINIRKKALNNIQLAQERQKKNYDAKHCKDKEKYVVGTLVLLRNSKKLSRKGSKMEQNWLGPYRIIENVKKNTYRLCSRNDNKKVLRTLVNMSRLKIYHEDPAKVR